MRNIKYLILLIINIMMIFYTNSALGAESNPVYEQYYLTKIKDTPIGNSRISREEQQDGNKKQLITNTHYELKFKRLGFAVKILQDLQYIEDEAGIPVSFLANIESKGETVKIQGEFLSDKRLHITSDINGVVKSEEIELKKKILFPYAIEKLFRESNQDVIEYSTVDPSDGVKIVTIKAERMGLETLTEEDLNGDYVKYKISLDMLPGITNYEWYDSQGKVVKEKSSLLGLERMAVNREKIIGNIGSFDIFYKSIIPVSTHISDASSLDYASYKIETQSANPEQAFISDDRQRIIQTRGNTIYLKIKSQQINQDFKYPVDAREYPEYLKSGPYINADDPEISELAKSIARQEKDAYKISRKMEKWVFDNIKAKDLSVNFASATEVMKLRQGDCTEHSVLLASLLRAAGIPSKVVVGLMYTNIPQDAFAYHMWVSAYIGKWISLDPSFPDENFSPTHIAISENSLNNLSGKTDIVLDIVKTFSTIKINILNYTTAANNIVGVNLSDNPKPVDTKISMQDAVVTNNDSPIKNISLKDNEDIPSLSDETRKKYIEDTTRSGFYNFSKGNISEAIDDFEKVARLIPYNDDSSDVKLALKLATLGLFNLTDKQLKNVYDNRIWERQIKDIKVIYYPAEILPPEKEAILAEALSKANFQNDTAGAIALINGEGGLAKTDYAHYILAKAYLSMNRSETAFDELTKAISKNPVNLSYRLDLAKVCTKKNDFKRARKELDFILKQNISDKKFIELVNTELYWLLFKSNRQNNTRSQYYLARYYNEKGEYKAAVDILNKLINNKQEDSSIRDLLGDIYLKLNQPSDARLSYNKAINLNRRSVKAVLGVGNTFRKEGKYKEALNEYLKAEKINSEYPDLILAIAEVYRLLAQEEAAYKYYVKLLDINENNIVANYNVGLMYQNGDKIAKAEEYFKKALSIDPNHSKSWLALAKLELNRKNYFLAKTYLDSVNYVGQENLPEYYYYLGLIYKNNENYSSAKNNLKKAVDLKPDYKEAIQELEKIKD